MTLLVNTIASPLQVGVYQNETLHERYIEEGKTSDVLLPLLMKLLQRYPVSRIVYARGPGSYMAIKLTYVTLKSIEVVQGIPCFGCSAFTLNNNQPVKAMGNLYFIKEKETIITKKFDTPVEAAFVLPQSIQDLEIDEESAPAYLLPAV